MKLMLKKINYAFIKTDKKQLSYFSIHLVKPLYLFK